MEDHCLPRIVLCGALSSGYHNIRAPKSTWRSPWVLATLTTTMQWSTLAADHEAWRHTIHQAVSSFENTCMDSLVDTRRRRKNCEVPASNQDQTLTCSLCGRICPSCTGLGQSPMSLQIPWTMPLKNLCLWSQAKREREREKRKIISFDYKGEFCYSPLFK